MFKLNSREETRPGFTEDLIPRPLVIDEQTRRPHVNTRGIFVIILCYMLMSLTALGCLLSRILLLGKGENFCRLFIVKPIFRMFFKLVGIKINYPQVEIPAGQKIFVFNHSSTLDNFLIVALGLSNTRYFLSWKSTYKVIPMTITSLLLGTYYTPSQKDREARVKCFQNAERTLRETGYSTILSPEGARICTGEIGPFNKGSFHMATNLKVPIVPLYIYIPHHINPWATFFIQPGQVTVDVLPAIDTSQWLLSELDTNREEVRNIFIQHHLMRHENDRWF